MTQHKYQTRLQSRLSQVTKIAFTPINAKSSLYSCTMQNGSIQSFSFDVLCSNETTTKLLQQRMREVSIQRAQATLRWIEELKTMGIEVPWWF